VHSASYSAKFCKVIVKTKGCILWLKVYIREISTGVAYKI